MQTGIGRSLRGNGSCPVRINRPRRPRSDSDVDVLVAFNGPATSERYFGVQFYLEDLFDAPIDLVTENALRPELRPFVEKEAVYV